MDGPVSPTPLVIRPYLALCAVCALGRECPRAEDAPARELAQQVAESPDRPVTLVCNVGDVYAWQDPGDADDTPGGAEYNLKRDLTILERLGLPPGGTLPARTLLMILLDQVDSPLGICGYETVTSDAWRGCPETHTGAYARGRAKAADTLFPPEEPAALAMEKDASVWVMHQGGGLSIRPHVAMCAVCHFGQSEGRYVPLEADNIAEFIDVIRRRPDVPVTMAWGADWMVCAPCPKRVAELNACVNVLGSGGLTNQQRDLEVLQRLGLTYGATLPGRRFLELLFERLPTTQPVCARPHDPPSVWWDGCGEQNRTHGNRGYERGRDLLLAEWATTA